MTATSHELVFDAVNADQVRAWDGDEGRFWAENAPAFDRAIAALYEPFLAAAAIGREERVLDIGCGTGQTTRDAARLAAGGTALGVDLSARMIARARELAVAEGCANAQFEQADAQIHAFAPGGYDLAISRTGAMFFGDPVAAFTNIGRALRPGGRLVLLAWQGLAENEWIRAITIALAAGRNLPPLSSDAPAPYAPGPFALSDRDRVRALLTSAGLGEIRIDPQIGPMHFGRDVDEATPFILGVAGWMLHGLDDNTRDRAVQALRASIAAHTSTDGVNYDAASWIINAVRL